MSELELEKWISTLGRTGIIVLYPHVFTRHMIKRGFMHMHMQLGHYKVRESPYQCASMYGVMEMTTQRGVTIDMWSQTGAWEAPQENGIYYHRHQYAMGLTVTALIATGSEVINDDRLSERWKARIEEARQWGDRRDLCLSRLCTRSHAIRSTIHKSNDVLSAGLRSCEESEPILYTRDLNY